MQALCHYIRRSTAIEVGRARLVFIAPLREIDLPPNRPFNCRSNGVSHMQVDPAAPGA